MVDIIIVEDNKELADLLCDFLRAENYTVSIAETGEKALQLYEKYGARLIVLDIIFRVWMGSPCAGRSVRSRTRPF